MYAFIVFSEIPVWADTAARTDQAYLVGNLFRQGHGRGGDWVRTFVFATHQRTGFVGARPFVVSRNRAAISCRDRHHAAHYHGQLVPRSRCVVGTGRWLALSRACCGDWRALGRSARVRFYRNQTVGAPVRGRGCALLVDPPCRHAESQRGARALANWIRPVSLTSLRRLRTGHTALVARSVSIAPIKAGPMDSDI